MRDDPQYSDEPVYKDEFTAAFDSFYSRYARFYDLGIKILPVWKTWLRHALPPIQGPRVLEVSFGTGYLLTQYAHRFETYGIDYNEAMVATAAKNLLEREVVAYLYQGRVEALPYRDASFDSVLNTMAFSGYPDSRQAMSEMHRVLKRGGKLIMIAVNYPTNGNWLGTRMTHFWQYTGDLIRDIDALLRAFDFDYTDQEIGAYGSVHLYVCRKR